MTLQRKLRNGLKSVSGLIRQVVSNHSLLVAWNLMSGPIQDADNGENLATNYASPNSSVAAWIVEEEDYDASEAKFSKQTGHFTQVVWKETERVGCAAKDCGDPEEEIEEDGPARGWYLACQYSPQGNVKGQFKENVEKVGDSGVAGRGVGVAGVGLMVLGLTVAGLVGL